MAGRTGAVLSRGAQEALSRSVAGSRYTYLPWVDLICAGVPCQDWSVAGQRKGLSGTRSSLVYQFARILHTLRPTWFLFENVPGLLSSNDGRDFAEVLRLFMVKCGYGIQWRVLDSQFFGVAQRRRRLFIVGRFGKPCPPEILFEPESGAGNFAEGGDAGQSVAGKVGEGIVGTLKFSAKGGACRLDAEQCADGFLVAAPITASYGKQVDSSDTSGGPPNLILGRQPANGHSRLLHAGERPDDARETEIRGSAYSAGFLAGNSPTAGSIGYRDEQSPTLKSGESGTNQVPTIAFASLRGLGSGGPDDNDGQANRIIECAPSDSDRVRDFTGLPKGMDSPRYRALGNAVTVDVIEWIGRRIVEVTSKENQ